MSSIHLSTMPSTQQGYSRPNSYSVSQLNREVKTLLETSYRDIWVQGEVSNLAKPASGHLYFSLKDEKTQIRCAYFRQRRIKNSTSAENGMEVLVRGQLSLYEGRGDFQLIVSQLEPAGEGALQRAFEQLKKKLNEQGIFSAELKNPLPALPHRIGVISSPSGAAFRDVLATLERRFPLIPIVVYPSLVQGPDAADNLIEMIQRANTTPVSSRCDVLILTRGGGSLEDLWAFNDERLAYIIRDSKIPIVSGVGHEIDFTIADFVADFRAATPTAAAEAVTPDQSEIENRISSLTVRLGLCTDRKISTYSQHLDWLNRSLTHPRQLLALRWQRLSSAQKHVSFHLKNMLPAFHTKAVSARQRLLRQSPRVQLIYRKQRLEMAHHSLRISLDRYLSENKKSLQLQTKTLNDISPKATLHRGYAILQEKGSQKIIRHPQQVKSGEQITATVADGKLDLTVDDSST